VTLSFLVLIIIRKTGRLGTKNEKSDAQNRQYNQMFEAQTTKKLQNKKESKEKESSRKELRKSDSNRETPTQKNKLGR
jgi:prophage antirepressor-like protein